MEAAFKRHPNGGDDNSGSKNSLESPQVKSTSNSLLSTLQRHRKHSNNNNKTESAGDKPVKIEKLSKRSTGSSFKTFFNKFGSRGMLLYANRPEPGDVAGDIMEYDAKQPLVIKSEKEPVNSAATYKKTSSSIYHRHSLSRTEFYTYIKCDDPTDGLSLERKSTSAEEEKEEVVNLDKRMNDKEPKKTSSLKRSHFPYSFLRSKLGTLQEHDRQHLLAGDTSFNVDVSRQNSITSLDLRPATITTAVTPHRQVANVRQLTRHLSSNESGYDTDSGRNVDSVESPSKWSPRTSVDDQSAPVGEGIRKTRHLVIKQLNESEGVGIVAKLKLLPSSHHDHQLGQIPVVVEALTEHGAAFR